MKQDFEKYAMTHEMIEVPLFLKKLLSANIKLKKEMKILDYGCGDGGLLIYLSSHILKKNLYGVEVSKIRVAKVKNKGFKCHFINKDKVKLKFKNNFFDVVMLIEVIEHVPKEIISDVLKEINSVLKKDGKLILTTPNYPIKRVYDYLMLLKGKSMLKIIRDDPTHITKYNFRRLKQTLNKVFKQVETYPTCILFENQLKN